MSCNTRTLPHFQGRFVTPDKSEWVKAYPKTGEATYDQWVAFCYENRQEMKELPDSFTLSYHIDKMPGDRYYRGHDILSCQFLSDKNEVVQWQTAVQRKGTYDFKREEIMGFQSWYDSSVKEGYREHFEKQWTFLTGLFQTVSASVVLEDRVTAPNIGNLFWVSPSLITDRKQYLGDDNGAHRIFNEMYNPIAGASHQERYALYKKMAVQHHDKLSQMGPGFWMECNTRSERVRDSSYYQDVITLCRQTYPGGPVQRWEIASASPQAIDRKEEYHDWEGHIPACKKSLEESIEEYFLKSFQKALAMSQTLFPIVRPGEKEC